MYDSPTKTPREGYGAVSILLHWLGAAAVVSLFVLGQRIEGIPRGTERIAAQALHIGLGMAAFLPLLLRVGWRLGRPVAHPASGAPALDRVARIVQAGLLASIGVLIVTGPLSVWSGGKAIEVFGLVSLPSPLPRIPWLHEAAEVVHGVTSKVVLALTLLHVAGALKHLVIDRDGVVKRMLVPAAGGR